MLYKNHRCAVDAVQQVVLTALVAMKRSDLHQENNLLSLLDLGTTKRQLFPALTPAADMSYLLCRDEI